MHTSPGERTNSSVIVLANRAPVTHELDAEGRAVATRHASGLVTALEPLVQAVGGTWVAHAAGAGDLVAANARGRLACGSSSAPYRLRYVALPEDAHRGYYCGFANE